MARIFLSAGEASGERYAEELMNCLRERALPGEAVEFFGLGGKRMEEAGMHRIARAEDVSVVGITEIVRHIPRIYREYRRLRRSLRELRPTVAVFIDFPDVNLALARYCRRLGIPVIYFVGPQVWAWKQHRLKRIQRDVDRMLVIFPFEEKWYRDRGVNAKFVGHPLAAAPLPALSRHELAERHGLYEDRHYVALLPGSRPREIELNLPTMLEAATLLEQERPLQHEFILPLAPTLTPGQIAKIREIASPYIEKLPLVFTRDARAALFHARASIVASGTATVEAALMGNPFVVVYRLSNLSYAVAKRVVKVSHVAMPNLIAGQRVVPELIQERYTPLSVVSVIKPCLDDGAERTKMIEGLASIQQQLHQERSAIDSVADEVMLSLASKTPRRTSDQA